MSRTCIPLIAVFLVAQLAHAEANWPRWRGPNDNGGAVSGKYPAAFGPKKNVTWKVELPGKGCSTPIVIDGKVIVTAPLDGLDAVLAFDLDGKSLWTTTVDKGRPGKHRNGSSSNPSPTTDGELVFTYFRSGNLASIDLKSGKLLWKTNLQRSFGGDTLYWDIGTSPVLTKKHVVIAVMHSGESYLVAFDKRSGQLAWRVPRNYKTPVEGDHSYATPILIQHKDKDAILVWGAEHLTIHDPADGKMLYECGGFNPNKTRNWVQVASPVVVDGIAVIPYGRGSRMAGIKLDGTGEVTSTHRLWTREDTGSFVPSPAASGGTVYLVRDGGEIISVDPKTGKTLSQGKFPRHRAKFYSSPSVADGKIYAAREDGVVLVADINKGFELLAENDMGERVIASPVPVDGRLFIRGERHLFCIQGK